MTPASYKKTAGKWNEGGWEIWRSSGSVLVKVAWFYLESEADAYLLATKAGLDFPNLILEGMAIIEAQKLVGR